MYAEDFEIGDLVWAKMKGFSFWPAKITEPSKPPHTKKYHHFVYFFGSKNYAWILDELIVPHSESMLSSVPAKQSVSLRSAIEEIIAASQEVGTSTKHKQGNSNHVSNEPSIKTKLTLKYKKLKESKKIKRSQPKGPKKRLFGNASGRSKYSYLSSFKVQKPEAVIHPYDDDISDLSSTHSDGSHSPQHSVDRISLKTTQVESIPSATAHVQPTDKKIGFLGLGMIGQRIVRNLLKSGHHVTVWNRTPEKCDDFIKAGALRGETPAAVVMASDITFSCVSDREASKSLVFGTNGVLKGLEGNKVKKGYVEMTSMDEQTSQEIAEAVTVEGGRYLEAPMSGSSHLAEEGSLIILGSGDRDLFDDCVTCFHAISKHAYYISCDVGRGANYSLISSMLLGTTCAALGEAMALAERAKVSQKDFLEILQFKGFTCPLFMDKGKAILNRRFPTSTSLKNQQKDINLALHLSHNTDQPMAVTAAANELYKHTKQLGYTVQDASCVYMGAKL